MHYSYVSTDHGRLLVAGDERGLREISFERGTGHRGPRAEWKRDSAALEEAERQLRAYFAGELREFSLDLAPEGTQFQRQVWNALLTIPYGETTSYGEIARAIGRPDACRAVGAANGSNPLPIVIPCHRVIGSTGKLTGYGGGLWIKEALLDLEGVEHRRTTPQPSLWTT
jgi:methylated-DNA-[protein]-cysteine S-methyltransferase